MNHILQVFFLVLTGAHVSAISCTDNTTAAEVIIGRDLTGQIQVLTGGDSGIGYQTALALASANASLIIASYDVDGTGATAAAAISETTGNTKIAVVPLDLSSLASVAACAAAVMDLVTINKSPFEREATDGAWIDVLLCDAGIDEPHTPEPTADGFDEVIEVNFIGHVALIEALLPLLRQSPNGGRVVEVASVASFSACDWGNYPSDCTDLENFPSEVAVSPVPAMNSLGVNASNYGFSKYAMVFHAAELAKREASLTVAGGSSGGGGGLLAFSLHPGLVATAMTESLTPETLAEWCSSTAPYDPCPLTASQGAATPTFLCAATRDEVEAFSGAYFDLCKPALSVRAVYAATHGGEANTATYQSSFYDAALGWAQGST
jgi:NAD(P)-dependent dehydrogenase (short-subunit alcohol dehydrogenase family)